MSESDFFTFLEQLPDAAIVANKQGTIIHANKSATDTFGYSAKDLAGKNVKVLWSLEIDDSQKNYFKSIKGYGRKIIAKDKKGVSFPILVSVSEHKSEKEVQYLGLFRDISSFENPQTKFAQYEKYAKIGQLAAGVGHEINNPLAVITGHLRTLGKKIHTEPEEKIRKRIDSALLAADRIGRIVRSLRTFSRSESSKISTFDVADTVKETITLIDNVYFKDNISIRLSGEESELNITGSYGKVQQILMSLLTNSREAILNSNQSGSFVITIEYSTQNQNAVIDVIDNGPGIPTYEHEKIFDLFFSNNPVGKGAGLGLSAARELARDMNGDLELVSSRPGETHFRIKFPLTLGPIENARKSLEFTKNTSNHQLSELVTLVVEDEPMVRTMIVELLKCMGIEKIHQAENGMFGAHLVENIHVDLVLTDLYMPTMDGIGFIHCIHQVCNPLPVIAIITGDRGDENDKQKRTLDSLTDFYLTKPISEDLLTKVLEKALQRKAILNSEAIKSPEQHV